MAAIHDLINQIQDPALRAKIEQEVEKLTKQKKFGLVFEEHLPECTLLYDIPVRKGLKVSVRDGKANETYTVLKVTDGRAVCLPKDGAELLRAMISSIEIYKGKHADGHLIKTIHFTFPVTYDGESGVLFVSSTGGEVETVVLMLRAR